MFTQNRQLVALFCAVLLPCLAAQAAEERKAVRVLMDFEDGADAEALKQTGQDVEFDVVQDNGVTSGKNCCRVVGKAGAGFSTFELRGEKLKGWGDFDYFAMDVFTEREEKLRIVFELWDADAKNYGTRCTFEDTDTHVGRNTLMWRINRARRNNKEGRDWEELEPKDKIRMNALSKVKIFFTPFAQGGNTVLWLDNLRLMQEDAAVPKFQLALPEGAKAFDFGPRTISVAGFTPVGAASPGVSGQGVKEAGKAWPDPLTGNGIESAKGAFQFEVAVPDGEYWVWISAGRVLDAASRRLPYALKVGDQTLCDEQIMDAEFYGEKGLFRFVRTPYSQRPNALWLDYVLPVCPEATVKAKAEGGKLVVTVSNHRLSALVVMPAKDEEAFKKLTAEIRRQRVQLFYNPRYSDPHEPPKAAEGDGAYALWLPAHTRAVRPWSAPTAEERKAKALDVKAAPGQRVVARVCVTPFEDLGEGELSLSDLTGPGTIPAANARIYWQNYRVAGTGVDEMAVLPWAKIRCEPQTTWAYWVWLQVPKDAPAGTYRGTVEFKPGKGGARSVPVALEVYPFQLEDILPVSYGMYYDAWTFPEGFDRRKLIREQLAFMREVGFTGACIGSGHVAGLGAEGATRMTFDPFMLELAKEAGMGRCPEQRQMGNTLGMARAIARSLGSKVDQNPGCEFAQPKLKGYYQDAVKQYAAFLAKMGLPVALETVDEPREMPNPWNRNLEQTNTYADWAKGACDVPVFVTPMGDGGSGKDYTSLAEHHDIISVHAYEGSKRLIERTRALKKTLWFYNTGRDRLSWGFYAWKMGAKGRWEWHWSSDGGPTADGYPAEGEGYSPFTGCAEMSMRAPYGTFPGGFLFKSAYLDIAEGVNDYAYLVTLEKALDAAGNDAAKAATVKEGRAFLEALKKSIPEYPGIKGLSSPDAGALVGAGLETPVAELTPMWRAKIGELLKGLKK